MTVIKDGEMEINGIGKSIDSWQARIIVSVRPNCSGVLSFQ